MQPIAPDAVERSGRIELADTGAGMLVLRDDGADRHLVGFVDVTDWHAIEDACRARGHTPGDVLHLPEFGSVAEARGAL